MTDQPDPNAIPPDEPDDDEDGEDEGLPDDFPMPGKRVLTDKPELDIGPTTVDDPGEDPGDVDHEETTEEPGP